MASQEDTLKEWIAQFGTDNSEMAFVQLVALGSPAVGPLIEALHDENQDVRRGAIYALGEIGESAVELLIKALEDEDENVRFLVVYTLGRIGDVRAVQSLIHMLKDEDQYVRLQAVKALGKFGDVRAVEPLIAALEDHYWGVRSAAVEALGEIGGVRALEAILRAMDDKSKMVRQSAARVIGEIRDTIRAVRTVMADRHLTTQQRLQVLSELRNTLPHAMRDIRQLCEQLMQDEDMAVREGAHAMLEQSNTDSPLGKRYQEGDILQE